MVTHDDTTYTRRLVERILSDRRDPGLRAMISKAGLEQTEDHAYGYFRMPESIYRWPERRIPVLRIGAAIAATKNPQVEGAGFGRAMRVLATRRGELAHGIPSGSVSDRMKVLLSQPAEQAVETVRSLLQMASTEGGIGLDHHLLMNTMFWWESADLQRDTHHRRRLLLEFNTPPAGQGTTAS